MVDFRPLLPYLADLCVVLGSRADNEPTEDSNGYDGHGPAPGAACQ